MIGTWQRLGSRVSAAMVGKGLVSLAVVALVGIFLVQISGGPVPSPSPSPGPTQVVTRPTDTPGPTGSPEPTPTPEPWEDFDLPPVALVADLAPANADAAGVALDSTFVLRSLDGSPAAELAKRVQSQPALDLRTRPGATADVAILAPREPLLEGVLYRFRVYATDGSLAGSWAFRAQQPLRVVGTLPGDMTTDVPVNTGIEVTFDRDGTTDVASHFRIEPAVTGRFEAHGRTWAFVPARPLQPATAYTVTVDAGVGIAGSSQVLETAVTFRFETQPVANTVREFPVRFDSPLIALRPSDRIALSVGYAYDYDDEEDEKGVMPWPETLPVDIYRLPGRDATVAAAERLTGPDSWLRTSGIGLVETDDLRLVAEVDARLSRGQDEIVHLVIPVELDPGAYLVVVPRQRGTAQAIIQIRSLSAYAMTTDTRSIAWVNDLATLEGVRGAIVADAGGRQLGVTATDGLAEFPTPERLLPTAASAAEWWDPWPTIISITTPDGRWIVAALGSVRSWYGWENQMSMADWPSTRYWLLLRTDRQQYRQTDTIHAWGVARLRADRSVPADVELRLYPEDGDAKVPLARAAVTVTPNGMFAGDLPIAGLPMGSYVLGLFIDDQEAVSTWLGVRQIRKPSYRLEVTTDKHVYLDGEPMEITIQASFFDGSTLPNAELRVSAEGASEDEANLSKVVTTDAAGKATITMPATYLDERPFGWRDQGIWVRPVNAEESEISGDTRVVVFPSRAWLTGLATIDGTTVTASGRLSRVDFPAVEAVLADAWAWDLDPAGRPIGGATVSATVIQHVTTRRQTGTEYDFIEKQVVPVYVYDQHERTIGTFQTSTAADGSFRFSIDVPKKTDDYTVVLRAADGAGRRIMITEWADSPLRLSGIDWPSYLLQGSGCGGTPVTTVGLGEPAVLTLHDGDGRIADEGRFLFIVGSAGLVDASVSEDATFREVLDEGLLPGFTVRAVQVRGAGYLTADARVEPNLDELRISVRLQSDRDRYEPGGTATIGITTTGPDGRPVAATVVLQGVDEKLYAIGAADVSDPTGELFWPLDPGFLQTAATHLAARFSEGGCGAAGGGGGVRDDFGDNVIFQLVRTGADGRASVSVKLLDDLTSWRLTAFGLTKDLRTGLGSVSLPVSLPFFVEAVLAPDYLVGEEAVLRVRAYGDSLRTGDDVAFTVSAPSLGLGETRVEGVAFEAVRVPLPTLTEGEHRVTIAGVGPTATLHDTLIRVIHVLPSRVTGVETRHDPLTAGYQPPGGEGLTRYLVVDAGRGSLISLLDELATATSARFDRALAAELARTILVDEYGVDPATLPARSFDVTRYQRGYVALLPYASGDLELTALAALAAPEQLDAGSLREWGVEGDEGSPPTRERTIVTFTLLAALHEDVLDELRSFETADLTIREQLWLALGIAAAGDEHGARAIERRLLEAHGQRFGPWVRLEVGGSLEETLEAGRLLLVLSSRLGEPFAREVARYLADHPSKQRSFALEQIAYVRAMLDRLPKEAARFAWTVAGQRHEVELEPGEAHRLVLSAEQRASLRLEPLAGELAVVATWTSSETPMPTGDQATITRSVSPTNDANDDRLVRVVITVSFNTYATSSCWQITDLAPSGLAPLQQRWAWDDEDEDRGIGPYEIEGQRVSWCASPRDNQRTFAYLARVVSPGTYRWEPAVIRSVYAPEIGAATESLTYRIR